MNYQLIFIVDIALDRMTDILDIYITIIWNI